MVRDTWHMVSGSKGATCQIYDESNMSSSVGHGWTYDMMPLDENPKVEG